MTATTPVLDRPDALDLEDELLDLTADLLALRAYQGVLVQLFGRDVGQWENLSELLQGFPEMHSYWRWRPQQKGGCRSTGSGILRRVKPIVWCYF
jgi:hypothetical protein